MTYCQLGTFRSAWEKYGWPFSPGAKFAWPWTGIAEVFKSQAKVDKERAEELGVPTAIPKTLPSAGNGESLWTSPSTRGLLIASGIVLAGGLAIWWWRRKRRKVAKSPSFDKLTNWR